MLIKNKDKINYLLLALVLLITLVNVLHFLFSVNVGMWHDASFTYLYSQEPISFIMDSNDVHPPLYYVIFKFIMQFSHNELWLRGFNIAFFLLYGIYVFRIGKEGVDSQTGLVATMIALSCPTLIYYAVEPRNYMLGMALCAMQFFYFQRKFLLNETKHENDKSVTAIQLTITTILMLFTHYYTGFLLIVEALLVYINPEKFNKYIKDQNKIVTFLGCCSIIGAFGLWLLTYFFNTLQKMQSMWFDPITLQTILTAISYQFTKAEYANILYLVIMSGFLIAIAIYSYYSFRSMDYLLVFIVPLFLLFAISQFYPVFHPRFFTFFSFGLYIPIAMLITRCKNIFVLVGVISLLFLAIGSVGFSFTNNFKMNYMYDTQSFIKDNFHDIKTNDITFVHVSTFSQSPFKYYFRNYDNVENLLYTELNRKQLFTAGGSVVEDKEIINASANETIRQTDSNLYLIKGVNNTAKFDVTEKLYQKEGVQIFNVSRVGKHE